MEVIENYRYESWNRSRGKEINTIFSVLLGLLVWVFFVCWFLFLFFIAHILKSVYTNLIIICYSWAIKYETCLEGNGGETKQRFLKKCHPIRNKWIYCKCSARSLSACRAKTDPSVITPVSMVHESNIAFSVCGELSFLNEYAKEPHTRTDSSYKNIYSFISILLAFLMSVLYLLEFWPWWKCNKRQTCNILVRLWKKKYPWKPAFRESAARYWE